MIKTIIQIGVDEKGGIHLQAPLHDKIQCLGLLEIAKKLVLDTPAARPEEPKIAVVPAAPHLMKTN